MDKNKIGILALALVIANSGYAGAMGPIRAKSWTGLYLGGQLGEAWGYEIIRQENTAGTRLGQVSTNDSSFIGGGYVGLNWQLHDFLIGVEGDAVGLNFNNYGTCLYQESGVGNPSPGSCFSPTYNYDIEVPWQAAARGRIGWIWYETLFYVAGGVLFTQVNSTYTTSANYVSTGSEQNHNNYVGSTAGIGMEYRFNNHWLARAEYRYNNYGIDNHLITDGGGFWNQTVVNNYFKDNSFRVGLAFLI